MHLKDDPITLICAGFVFAEILSDAAHSLTICSFSGVTNITQKDGQFGPWTIRTLVNSDLIRTSAVDNSDLGQFGPWSIRTSTTGQFGPHKNEVRIDQCFFENRVRIDQGPN